jgi:hypothetical protein
VNSCRRPPAQTAPFPFLKTVFGIARSGVRLA